MHLQDLKAQVDNAYDRAAELRQHNRNEINIVFKQKKVKRKKHGIVALETWLRLANSVLDKATERANSKLMKWLQMKEAHIETTSKLQGT